ncbi:transposase [Streptomyces sp. NPDC098789]|uniref:IS110 family transposase n=1 Tax=Streptomyces sp. NPDC098789 TaxID=3366098 RepID=UPI00381909AB
MPELWTGTDASKAVHRCTVIDTDGTKVLSRRVPNNAPKLLEVIGDILALAKDSPVTWAVNLNAGGGALLLHFDAIGQARPPSWSRGRVALLGARRTARHRSAE